MTAKEVTFCKRSGIGLQAMNSSVARARKFIEVDPKPHNVAKVLKGLWVTAYLKGKRKAELDLMREIGRP